MVEGTRKKVKAFLNWWVTPRQPLTTNARRLDRPWVIIPSTIVIVFLDWLYFGVFVPYSTIPNKEIFWAATAAWAIPPLVVVWKYRDSPELKVRNATGNLFIAIGIVGLAVVVLWPSYYFLPPIGLAAMPAVLTGTLTGGIAGFLSKHFKT